MPFWPWSPTPTADPPPVRDPVTGMAAGKRGPMADPAAGRYAVPVAVPIAMPPPPPSSLAADPAWPPPHWKLGASMTPEQQRAYQAWLGGSTARPVAMPIPQPARHAPPPGLPAVHGSLPPFVIDRSAPPLPTRIVWAPPTYAAGAGELADTGGQ